MGRLLPGEGSRKNDGTILKPKTIVKRTPVVARQPAPVARPIPKASVTPLPKNQSSGTVKRQQARKPKPKPDGQTLDHRGNKTLSPAAALAIVLGGELQKVGTAVKPPIQGSGKAQTHASAGSGLASIDSVLSGKASAGLVEDLKKSIKPGDFLRAGFQPAAGAIADSGLIPALSQGSRKVADDAVDLVANAVPAVYETGKTAIDKGPLAAGKMLAQPFIDAAKDPIGSAKAHPLNTFLLASGAEGAVGHGLGKTLRTAPVKSLRKLGSTERPAATRVVEGTSLAKPGRYSKDTVKKAVQAGADKARGHTAQAPREMGSGQIAKRVDRTVAANEDIRRIHRGETAHAATEALGKKPTAATTLAAQNIIDASKADLVAYRDQVARHAPEGASDQRTHAVTLKALDQAIKKHDEARVAESASASRAIGAPLQQKMARETGLLDPVEAERAALIPYAIQKMGAKHAVPIEDQHALEAAQIRFDEAKARAGDAPSDKRKAQLDTARGALEQAKDEARPEQIVDQHGNPISNEQILHHMAEHGVEPPAFVPHGPNQRGARNYYVSQMRAPNPISGGRRTGKAVQTGVMDVHPDTLVDSAVHTQGRIDAAEGYGRQIREVAYKPGGKLLAKDRKSMAKVVDDLNAAGKTQFALVRLVPQFARGSQHDAMVSHATDGDAIVEAVKGGGHDTSGDWVAIPKAAADRIADHARGDGQDKYTRAYGSAFRTTVLSTSPKWLAGNAVEPALRSAVAHVGPRSAITNARVARSIEKQFGRDARMEFQARTQGGGMYGTRARLSKKVNTEDVAPDSALGHAVHLAKAAGQTPAPRAVANVWHAYTNVVFNKVNKAIETGFQGAMTGKAIRDSPLMQNRTMKLTQKAIDEAARGLVADPNLLAQVARDVETMYGKYNAFSPRMKRFVSSYTPFIPWTLNAIRFLAVTMPKDHPVLTSLLVAANEATEEWRKQHGLVASFFDVTPGAVSDFLQGSIPGGDGSHLRVSRYTPFGLGSSEGGVLGALGSSVLPQFSGVLKNTQGEDWKGDSLAGYGQTPSQADNALAALTSFITDGIPIIGQAATLGGVNLPNAAPTKAPKGTVKSRARKTFDPFMYTPGSTSAKAKPVGIGGTNGGSNVTTPNVQMPNVVLPNITLP